MKRTDLITQTEAIIVATKTRPSLTVRQIASILGISKSTVGRVLKSQGHCPRCGQLYQWWDKLGTGHE